MPDNKTMGSKKRKILAIQIVISGNWQLVTDTWLPTTSHRIKKYVKVTKIEIGSSLWSPLRADQIDIGSKYQPLMYFEKEFEERLHFG